MSGTPVTVTMLSVSSMIYDARIQREAKALRDAGYGVKILYIEDQEFFNSLPNPQTAWQDYQEHMEGIITHRYYLRARAWRWLPNVVNKFIQALELGWKFGTGVIKHKAEVFHVHDLTPAIFGLLGKWIHGADLVYDAHELEVEVSEAGSKTKALKRAYENLTVRSSTLSITVNDYIAGVMETAYGMPITVVGNKPKYVAADQLQPEILRQEAELSKEHKIVLYVGYLNLSRGIDKVVEALQFLDEQVTFVIMGTGRLNEFKKLLYELADANGISRSRIRFVGPFPPDKVIPYLSGADISVMLYQANTSNAVINAPNKLFQSVMARVPIVASHNKSFPVFINENRFGKIGVTVNETNPQAIADGIRFLLKESNQQICKENAGRYAQEVSWENEARKLIHAYPRGLAPREKVAKHD